MSPWRCKGRDYSAAFIVTAWTGGGAGARELRGCLARCHTAFNCTLACPRKIQITKAIGEL